MADSVAGSRFSTNDDAATQVFGFEPEAFVNDIYNCMFDYVADGVDSFEEAVKQDLTPSSSGRLPQRIDDELTTGCDALTSVLRDQFAKQVDLFEHYVLRNVFAIPPGLEEKLAAANEHGTDGSGESAEEDGSEPVSGPTCSEEELAAIERRTHELQSRLVKARRRKRALLAARRLCEKRLPQLREAGAAIDSAAAAVAASSSSSSSASASSAASTASSSVAETVRQAQRLDDMCVSLARAAGQGDHRRSTIAPSSSSAGGGTSTFGDVRAAFDADKAAGASTDAAAVQAAADALR